MSNMSYCRFENTTADMDECIEAIRNGDTEGMSEYELDALKQFIELARDIVDLEDKIESVLLQHDEA